MNKNTKKNDPRWGANNRDKKAKAIMQTISHFSKLQLETTDWLDIGCGSGGIAETIAPKVKSIIGLDIESWDRWKTFQGKHNNLNFYAEEINKTIIKDNSIDVVICNQVYEHVSDPLYLIQEIHRVLKPNGYCYFAGPNLLFPIEPHVFWPFVHWFPRKQAVQFMKLFGSKKILDAYSSNYWTLENWLSDFKINNAVPWMINNPERYGSNGLFWKVLSITPGFILDKMTWVSPSFVFVLKK